MSAMRAASSVSPSSFGSTAASSPAMIWSVREYTVYPPSASGCQPAIRTGRIDAPGATPCSPPGPSEPETIPASSVPCRSGRPGIVGCGCATAPLPGLIRSMPGSRLLRRYGCEGSMPGVEQRDRDSGPVEPGNLEPAHGRRGHVERLGGLGRKRRPNRVDGRRPRGRRSRARATSGRVGSRSR